MLHRFNAICAILIAIAFAFHIQSALAQNFSTEAEIKSALVGNTIKFPNSGRRGGTIFMYFGTDGEVVSVNDASKNVSRGKWSVDEAAQFCRERPYRPFNDVLCRKVRLDGKVVTFFDQNGKKHFSANILQGRQLP